MGLIYDASELKVTVEKFGTEIENFSEDGVDITTNIENSRIPKLMGTSGFNVSGDDTAEVSVNVISTSEEFSDLIGLWMDYYRVDKLTKDSISKLTINTSETGIEGMSTVTIENSIMSSAPDIALDSNEASSVEFVFLGYPIEFVE